MMVCPYNSFKPCVKEGCPAWRYVKSPLNSSYLLTCIIAVNGGVPNNSAATALGSIHDKPKE